MNIYKIICNIQMLLFLLVQSVISLCHCPSVCVEWCWDPYAAGSGDRAWCNDLEAMYECDRANWEYDDMLQSLAENIDMYLDSKVELNDITPSQMSIARTQLSLAIEHEKPLGDCQKEMLTNVLMNGTRALCYSQPVFNECEILRTSAVSYMAGISIKLRDYLDKIESTIFPNKFVDEFVDIVKIRTDTNTIRIRCESRDTVTAMIENKAYKNYDWFVTVFIATVVIM